MASNEIVSEEAEEREFVTNPKNQYVAAGIVSGLASLSIGTRVDMVGTNHNKVLTQ